MRSRPTIVFDGDDTLWIVEPLYDQAREAAAAVVAGAGLDSEQWVALQKKIDVNNVSRFGLSAARFPASCLEAYEALAKRSSTRSDHRVGERVAAIARAVFDAEAPLAAGAEEVLSALAPVYALELLTQGEPWVQERRIEQSGLGSFFASVHIVDEKTESSFAEVLSSCGATADRACSVGNSLPSDINPALALGMSAVWVAAEVWDYEMRQTSASPGRVFAVEHLNEVPGAVYQLLRRQHEALA